MIRNDTRPWLLVAAVVFALLAVGLDAFGGADAIESIDAFTELTLPFVFLPYAIVGAILAMRLPRHPVGWTLLGVGVAEIANNAALEWARFGVSRGAGHRYDVVASAWLSQWLWSSPVVVLGTFLLLLFPDGHLPSRRWRPVAWLAAAVAVASGMGRAFQPGGVANFAQIANPLGLGRPGGLLDDLVGSQVLDELTLALVLASILAFAVRFRRSRGVQRLQLKWFLAAAAVFGVGFVAVAFTDGGAVGWVIWSAGAMAIPVAVGIAILRYRLYDIDRVVSRTLTYGALTVILGAAYVGLVVAGQAVFSSFAGGSNLAVAVSTLVVAALFLPLRSRVQRAVDRRFNRHRYDAQRTLEAFGSRLREQVDLDELTTELRTVVAETMQPSHITFWHRGETGT